MLYFNQVPKGLFLLIGKLRGLLELIMNNTNINIRISIFHHKSQYFLANVSIFVNFWVERSDITVVYNSKSTVCSIIR